MIGGDRAIRVGATATTVVVAAIAAVASYRHALAVIRDHGETGLTAYLIPVSVDGLLLVAALVMLDAARRGTRSPWLAKLALVTGIAATIALNAMHGIERGAVSATLAALPAVTLIITVELLMGVIRTAREAAPEPVAGVEAEPVAEPWDESRPVGMELWETLPPAPAPVATAVPEVADQAADLPLESSVDSTPVPDLDPAVATGVPDGDRSPETAPEPVATGLTVVATTVPDEPEDETAEPGPVATGPETDPELEQVIATARDHFADVLATGRTPSIRSIRNEIKVGHPRAQIIREALSKSA